MPGETIASMAVDVVRDALALLAGQRHSGQAALDLVPREPGLYALHGGADAWSALGLVPGFDGQPLYVGKAESSLRDRDVRTHFAVGRTGSSTLRRSLAAFLRDELRLVPVPRNPARPDASAAFALDHGSDERLSAWMDEFLSLSTWVNPDGMVLEDVETQVIRRLRPPLNVSKVGESRTRLREARRRMADEARSRSRNVSDAVSPPLIQPPTAVVPSGDEAFVGLDASVLDFWRFAMSDLRTNNVRGYLAEFLVARAVGSEQTRVEWDAWDVTAPDGTRIEVKAAGYLQSWTQRKLTSPSFRVAAANSWDAATNTYSTEKGFNADVYVFCLQTAKAHADYDPLDVTQWSFYVVDRTTIEERAGASMGLSTLKRIAGDAVPYSSLRSTVERKAGTHPDRS